MPIYPKAQLRGRRSECLEIDQLVAQARAGQGGALLLVGEPGIGKTALLDYAGEHATGCSVARVNGAASERDLPFAGLHALCSPFLDRLPRLPEPQRAALEVAFGRAIGPVPDPFLVGLAALSLLAEVSDAAPLICLVDDVQAMDPASSRAIAFVARRLVAEPIAIILAARERNSLPGLPALIVRGLDDQVARALIDSSLPGRVDDSIRLRVLEEAGGNPLALQLLPQGLTAADLIAERTILKPRTLASQIEESFAARIRELPPETQLWLLLAASDPDGSVALLWSAAERLNLAAETSGPALEAKLIKLGTTVRFQHPFARSAAYRCGTEADRREAHRVLAELTDPTLSPDRRAWHRARASAGPDEVVAAELERAAGRAQQRGGVAAAAALMQRAVELSDTPTRRAERALTAAHACLHAGELDAAESLLAIAGGTQIDRHHPARVSRLRAQILFARCRGGAAHSLQETARSLREVDTDLARDAYLEAMGAAVVAGRTRPDDVRTVALSSQELMAATPPGGMDVRDLLLEGVSRRFVSGFPDGVPGMRGALREFQAPTSSGPHGVVGWLWVACPIAPEPIALELWDDDAWYDLATQATQIAREAGALATLPTALTYLSGVLLMTGHVAASASAIEEANSITIATGGDPLPYATVLLDAWRGDEETARATFEHELERAQRQGEGRAIGAVKLATAILCNGLGQYGEALAASKEACEFEDLGLFGWALLELIEAAVRCGEDATALDAMSVLEERTRVAGSNWARGAYARSRALVTPEAEAEKWYQEAVEHLQGTRCATHLARAHLVYGEWLRERDRRADAQSELRTAHGMLRKFEATAFAQRAAAGLTELGDAAAPGLVDDGRRAPLLTPQELHIAQLAGSGLTNVQIAAEIFLSRHTVDWHLRKVFAKLGVRSRRQLSSRLSQIGNV